MSNILSKLFESFFITSDLPAHKVPIEEEHEQLDYITVEMDELSLPPLSLSFPTLPPPPPPPPPPSFMPPPPSPPSPLLPSITSSASSLNTPNCDQETVDLLITKLEYLNSLVVEPQMFSIENFDHLKLQSHTNTVEDKLDTLFFEAGIPVHWKINVTWHDTLSDTTNTVHVEMLNHFVKIKAIELLQLYFTSCYNNTVYID